MGEAYHFDPWVATIAGAEVVDPLTVRIRLTQPTGPILTWLAFCGTGVVPRAAVEAGHDLSASRSARGPFRLAEPWTGGDAPIRLVAPRCLGARRRTCSRHGSPASSSVPSPLPKSARRPCSRGRIDLDALLAPEAFATVAATPDRVAHETPDSRWHWLVVNCRQAPLGDSACGAPSRGHRSPAS